MKMSRPASAALVQVPDQLLFAQRQRLETVGIELHDRDVVDAIQQIRPIRINLRLSRRDRQCGIRVLAGAAKQESGAD